MAIFSNDQNSGGGSDLKEERPDAPLTPKENHDATDRSAIRNQGGTIEPNPKESWASKHKSVAARKKVKGDGAAEEQRESKKKSAFNGKKTGEEEAAPSNPKKKKPQKQQQESAAVIAVAPLSVKESAQKSSNKTGHAWEVNDEAVIFCACLDSIPKITVETLVEVMKGKSRELQILEFEVCMQRIALMQEVCSAQIEALKETLAGLQ